MLQDKVVIVTGGAQGIGRHAAKTLAEQKAKIVIADFNEERAGRTAGELKQLSETLAIRVDVRNEDEAKKIWPGRTIAAKDGLRLEIKKRQTLTLD